MGDSPAGPCPPQLGGQGKRKGRGGVDLGLRGWDWRVAEGRSPEPFPVWAGFPSKGDGLDSSVVSLRLLPPLAQGGCGAKLGQRAQD